MVKVIKYLGPVRTRALDTFVNDALTAIQPQSNVFVSIYESNSIDNSPALLRTFDKELELMGVERLVITNDKSIPPPAMRQTSKSRIEFLAAVRNKVLVPLYERGGYDRVLFLNDIFYEAESVVELLKSRDGDWDQVCGTDFSYWGLYDVRINFPVDALRDAESCRQAWVIRDRLGALVSSVYPYVFEDVGMNKVMAGEPADVFSCWNGITAMRADPFFSPQQRNASTPLSGGSLSPWLPFGHPFYATNADTAPAKMPALRFRTSVDNYECFSSECFLISYDFRRQFSLNNIYINPRVIVAYDWNFYVWYKYIVRHWFVKYWIDNIERGAGYMFTRVTMGPKEHVYSAPLQSSRLVFETLTCPQIGTVGRASHSTRGDRSVFRAFFVSSLSLASTALSLTHAVNPLTLTPSSVILHQAPVLPLVRAHLSFRVIPLASPPAHLEHVQQCIEPDF